MRAQIGLADPSGGFFVLLLVGVLGLVGLGLGFAGAVLFVRRHRYWAVSLLFLAMVLTSPALWFGWVLFAPELPRDKSWDFSASRDVAQLQDDKPAGAHYYYQGNIRSTVKLAGDRHWSGNAYLVVFRTEAGKIADMHWQSRLSEAAAAHDLAGRILKDLALPATGLDDWRERVRRGEPAAFGVFEKTTAGESVEVMLRGSSEPDAWAVHVNVRWHEKS